MAELALLVVVRDAAQSAAIVAAIESGLGAKTTQCSTVAEALAAFFAGYFDCVVVDQELPDGGAFALVTELRAKDVHTPVVFATSQQDDEVLQRALEVGVTDFFAKSDISPRRLAFRLKFAIRVAQAESETARLLAQATAAARARDEVLAIVSHDLRGPLHAISLASEALRDELADNSMNRYLGAIDRAGARAERLISDLLEASAIENGVLQLQRARLDLNSVVRQAAADHELLATESGAKIQARVASEVLTVSLDRERTLQALANLIGNSIKHAQGTPIEIATERRGKKAVIAVTDRGPGIPDAELPHIFDRYWSGRAHKSGAGLGLAICKGIVLAHGGTIEAFSNPGQGARFEIQLPLAE